MRWALAILVLTLPSVASAQLVLDGEVDADDGVAYFTIPFEVPEGTVEIEIRHDDESDENILDWGVLSPSGFRGYGGGNTEPAVIGVAASSRSYHTGPIEAGTWAVYVGEAQIESTPATYHVEIDLRTEATLAPQPERAPYVAIEPLEVGARWYAGDFHVHSHQSGDAQPTLEEIALYAEMLGLDFVMLSEHNTTSQLELLRDVQARHPSVLFVPGIEVTTYAGHFMSMGGTTWIDHRLGVEGRSLDAMAADVHAAGALFTVNHPDLDVGDLCIGCSLTGELDPAAIDGMEVQTGAFSVTGRLFYSRVVDRWEALVMAGHRVVAVGGSDDHRAGTGTGTFDSPIGSPTTMVLADALSAEAILAGVASGRTVVKLEGPEDPMVELSSPDLIGDTITADYATLTVRVTGADIGATARLIRDGMRVDAREITGADVAVDFPLAAGASEDALRVELWVAGNPLVVTSHVFLVPVSPGGGDAGPTDAGGTDAGPPAASSGCACTAGARRPLGLGVSVVAMLVAACLRRRTR